MSKVILEKKFNYDNRIFALCESCYWTATILTKMENYKCPVCRACNVALIPLNLDEKYEYQFEPKQGLNIKFSINEEIKN
jgi:NMD protein affecting ribosome stability and mRNA decay